MYGKVHFSYVKPIVLVGKGAVEFTTASQDVIDSPDMPTQVKPIFQDFIVAIPALNSCVYPPDLQCLLDNYAATGLNGTEKAVGLTDGSLQQLFRMMLIFFQHADARLRKLPSDAGQEAIQIADTAFANEANWVQTYLKKLQQSKVV